MPSYFVKPGGPRPAFTVVIAFLWSDGHNVDTEGNSYDPASRSWTELYIGNRECEEEFVEVFPQDEDAPLLVLCVTSDHDEIAARVAWFLTTETAGTVAETPAGPFQSADVLIPRLGAGFDLQAAIRRARESPLASPTQAGH